MSYNLTDIAANSTGILDFTQSVNSVLMFGWLGTIFLFGLGSVMFMGFMWVTNDTSKAATATAFLMIGIGIIFRGLELISNTALFIIVILGAATVAALWNRT